MNDCVFWFFLMLWPTMSRCWAGTRLKRCSSASASWRTSWWPTIARWVKGDMSSIVMVSNECCKNIADSRAKGALVSCGWAVRCAQEETYATIAIRAHWQSVWTAHSGSHEISRRRSRTAAIGTMPSADDCPGYIRHWQGSLSVTDSRCQLPWFFSLIGIFAEMCCMLLVPCYDADIQFVRFFVHWLLRAHIVHGCCSWIVYWHTNRCT